MDLLLQLVELGGKHSRRGFLKKGLIALIGFAGITLARLPAMGRGEIFLSDRSTKRDVKLGMVIDLKRCIGCRACVIACKQENKTPPGVYYTQVLEQEVGTYPSVGRYLLPKPCFHCEHPSCTKVCPTGATYKRKSDGIVVIDYDICIGCRYCITACPYGARYFDYGEYYHPDKDEVDRIPSPEYGENRVRRGRRPPIEVTRKCHFCLHRVEKGLMPACVASCMTRAILFGDLNGLGSEVSRTLKERNGIRLKEELGNEPNVYYLL